MMFRKIVFDGHILGVSEVDQNGNIDEDEYHRLSAVIKAMPTAPNGYYYALRDADGEWELIEIPDPTDDDIDDAEALAILMGGAE